MTNSPALMASFNTQDKVLVHGVDLVAIVEQQRSIMGVPAHQIETDNYIVYFSNDENKEKFKTNPNKYLPQYGGFCSYGISLGKKFDVQKDVWFLHRGKLYFQLDKVTQNLWLKNPQEYIFTADKLWQEI